MCVIYRHTANHNVRDLQAHTGNLNVCDLQTHTGNLNVCDLQTHTGNLNVCDLQAHSKSLCVCANTAAGCCFLATGDALLARKGDAAAMRIDLGHCNHMD